MRKVYGIGETVLDLIFKDDVPVAAKAGGSALNAMVSLGRIGAPAFFISEIGCDKVGDMILRFFEQNKISSQYVSRFEGGKSALALAFLNERNDAEYEFFKDYPAQRLTGEMPVFQKDDIVLFGAYFGLNPQLRPMILSILSQAKERGAIVLYDPNFRSHHLPNHSVLISTIEENFALSDIVRGSDEDFYNIYSEMNTAKVYDRVKTKCSHLIVTANAKGVSTFDSNSSLHFDVPQIEPLSTIGAGDNFNAGIMKALLDFDIRKKDLNHLTEKDWKNIVSYGVAFSSEVCMSIENYVPVNFGNKLDLLK